MRLDLLLKDLSGVSSGVIAFSETEIAGITSDPELCQPGFLYVAAECETVDSTRYGVRLDGRRFIERALQRGATAVLSTQEVRIPFEYLKTVCLISHSQPLSIMGTLCSRFYGQPRPENIALVTGTNGKTSTVSFCRMLWSAAGHPSCSVGNLGGVCSDGSLVWDRDPTLSVPETAALHKMLNRLAHKSINHVAMEATSHALHDYRLHGVPAAIGAFTNLTRDHLDFHLTMEEYFRVKMTLFSEVLPEGSYAVLNADSPWFQQAREICRQRRHKVLTFGHDGTDIRLLEATSQSSGQKLSLEVLGNRYDCELNLFGLFQVSNALCSLGVVIASGVPAAQAVADINLLTEVEGRLNIVAVAPSGARIVVDYAHSPDGIRAALEACRSFTTGKLTIVFGCNGERDAGKRQEMGAMATNLADLVIVTDGHPRTEDPAKIRQEVLIGAPSATEIADRARAIEFGITALGSEDTLLVAGMGHETFQSVGGKRLPYSDTDTVRKTVAQLKDQSIRSD
jgi:UDP-N-acetylmuramoyl-L-alanyl-D-glutamate--2,6-diaminopimelate ligase